MPRLFSLLTLALIAGLLACRGSALQDAGPKARAPAPLSVFLVRHAETEADGSRNPGLSATGAARATRLAERLAHANLGAAYVTEYRRTQETAAPVAARHGVEVSVVPFGAGPTEAYAARLAMRVRADAGRLGAKTGVLVVGHSNTTPALAEALTGRAIPPIAEDEYDRLVTIVVFPDTAYYALSMTAP